MGHRKGEDGQMEIQRRKNLGRRSSGTAGGFQREAVPQACGLRNGLFRRQGGFHFPQRSGSRDGDLKPEAARASGLRQMPPAAFSVRK